MQRWDSRLSQPHQPRQGRLGLRVAHLETGTTVLSIRTATGDVVQAQLTPDQREALRKALVSPFPKKG